MDDWAKVREERRLGEFFVPGDLFWSPGTVCALQQLLGGMLIIEARPKHDPQGIIYTAYHPGFDRVPPMLMPDRYEMLYEQSRKLEEPAVRVTAVVLVRPKDARYEDGGAVRVAPFGAAVVKVEV